MTSTRESTLLTIGTNLSSYVTSVENGSGENEFWSKVLPELSSTGFIRISRNKNGGRSLLTNFLRGIVCVLILNLKT